MKKTISLLLSLFIVLSGILTGCGENPAQSEEETAPTSHGAIEGPVPGGAEEDPADAPETEEGLWRNDLPDDLDFNGETVTIHIRDGDNHNPTRNCIMEMTVEELNGELLNDAIYNRNLTVS